MKNFGHAGEGTKLRSPTHGFAALGEDMTELGAFNRRGASDEQGPVEGSVETVGAGGDVCPDIGELIHKSHDGGLEAIVLGNKRTEIDACCDAESGRDVLTELLGPYRTRG